MPAKAALRRHRIFSRMENPEAVVPISKLPTKVASKRLSLFLRMAHVGREGHGLRHRGGGNNKFGLLSVGLAAGAYLVLRFGLLAGASSTIFLLFLLLVGLGVTVLAAKGLGRDRNRGWATLGFALGLVGLLAISVAVIFPFFMKF